MGDRRPSLDTTLGRATMARTLAWLYLGAATLGLVSLALPHSRQTRVDALLTVILLAYAVGIVLLGRARQVPSALVPALLALGTLLITAAIHLDGNGASAYALLYVWVGVEAFYFLRPVEAAAQLAIVGCAYAWALSAAADPSQPAQRWVMTVGTAAVLGLLVAYLRRLIDGLVLRIHDASRTDPLTGLLNRRAFEELLGLELERAARADRPLSIVVGDLDGFERVNERLGHQGGDAALRALAESVRKWKRRVDVAARIGGEELALLLPDTTERGALLIAERLRRAVRTTFGAQQVPLTISFGVASFPAHAQAPDLLMRAADQALYAAKELGRDRSVVYSLEVARMLASGGPAEETGGELQLASVIGLAEALDIRDTGSARHCRAVARYAGMIAEALGLDAERVERVRLAGLLHDVGKIGVANGLPTKPGPLSDGEWTDMRTHPEVGARLLGRPELDDLRTWILAHHERPDGEGYPSGLSGDAIPLEARVLAVADAYEAMTTDRPYRAALGEQRARTELIEESGGQFDATVVAALLRSLDAREGSVVAPAVTK